MAVKEVIRVVFMAVFLGSLFIWIMMPTNTYKQIWLPHVRAKLNQSTYFGTQGANLMIYTFPVLFMAIAGCVYLHLAKKTNNNNRERGFGNHHLASLKRPILTKGPLGIVSIMELGFFMLFIALLVWSFSTYILNSFPKITAESAAEFRVKVWQDKLGTAGLMLGLVGNICLALLFFPVTRGSSVLPLFGLTSEGSIKYHIWVGHIVMALFTAHGLCFIICWASSNTISEMITWQKTGISNVAGELSLLAGLAMWLTTFPRIRRSFFELFFYTHYLYVLFIIFFILHVGISYCCIMLPGFYLFAVDRYLRFLQSRRRVRLVSARVLPCEALELNLAKSLGLSYNPMSLMFINVPSISKLQWHPFTVSSNSNLEREKLSVIIKGEGIWSKKLYQMLSSPSSIDRLEVSVEGPYGAVSPDFLRQDTLVMVSGGSGITPFISIIRELIFMSTTFNHKTPKVILICAFRNSQDLTMLDLILPISGTPSDISKLQLQIEAFVTREKEPKTDNDSPNPLRAVWFKPHATDAPISAVLGPNSWLWLGMIIASSFIIFLILIGVITSCYIYPIDNNTNKIFSSSWRAVLNMLVMCICIAITASAAVFWNKKKNAMVAMQVQNTADASPTGSPGSYDTELESLPHQPLAQAINVHYGARPNLKRMLLDCDGSSVKVFASGPKTLRHEVAAICSSGLADKLQFESISFSW